MVGDLGRPFRRETAWGMEGRGKSECESEITEDYWRLLKITGG